MKKIIKKYLIASCLILTMLFSSMSFAETLPTQWDLSMIFATDEDFLSTRTFIENNRLSTFKGKLNSPEAIYHCLKHYESLNIESNKLYVFASMHLDTDSTSEIYQTYKAQAIQSASRLGEDAAFIRSELLENSDDFILSLSKEERFSPFKFFLEGLVLERSNALDEKSEQILSKLTPLIQSPESIYTHLTLSDASFGIFTNHLGHTGPFDSEWDTIYLYSNDQNMRNKAYEALLSPYLSYANTIATTYIAQINTNVALSEIRGFDSPLAYGLMGSVSTDVYHNLIEAARKNVTTYQRYLNMKRESLGFDKLHTSDFHLPYGTEYADYFDYSEGVALMKASLEPLGEHYLNLVDDFVRGGHVDVYPNDFKTQSQYSWGAYGAPIYVLLNYYGSFGDVSTLTHEIGHAMHQSLIVNAQPYETSHIGPFPAEVSAIVNELFLMKHMENKTLELEEELAYFKHSLDFYIQTFFEQVMLADFEYSAHEIVRSGETLSLERLNTLWVDTCKVYFGDTVEIDAFYRHYWMTIPHLYSNHYVYAYPLSLTAAHAIKGHIQELGDAGVSDYLYFLSIGSSESPEVSLMKMGIDLTSSDFYTPLFAHMEDYIDVVSSQLANPSLKVNHPPTLLSLKNIENIFSYYGISKSSGNSLNAILVITITILVLLTILLVFLLILSEKSKRKACKKLLDFKKESQMQQDWE